MIGQFNKNPPLTFEVNGQFGADTGVVLWGDMLGTWENAFGFKGFSLGDVIAQIGFSPAACAYGCVSEFGLGAKFNVGSTLVAFDGNIAFPDMWNIFLSGSIDKTSPHQNLEVLDVANQWNVINPNNKVDTHLIPGGWAMQKAAFFFAPENGKFGPISYSAGFGVTAMLRIISMDVYFSLNCTGTNLECDFAFDISIDIGTVTKMIENELLLMGYPKNITDASWTIFKIRRVNLVEWSQQNSAAGVTPRWVWDMTVFNSDKHLDFRVRQYELTDSFHNFFVQWLKHLF